MRVGRGQAGRQGGGGARSGDLYCRWSTAAFFCLWLGFLIVGTGYGKPTDVFCPVLVGVRKLAVGPVSHVEDRVVGKGGGGDHVWKRMGGGSGGSWGSSGGGVVGRVEGGRGGGEEGFVVRVEVELSGGDDKSERGSVCGD